MSNVTLPPLGGGDSAVCLFQAEGHASQCYPSPTVWVAQGTTVVDLLCVEPGPIVCLIGRIRRPTQGTGRGSSCGALVGIPISSVIRRDSEWPTERERLGYVCNPRSLKEGTETSRPVATVAVPPLSCRVTGSAPQRKHELMRCNLSALILTRWSAAAGCNDRMPMSIGSFSYTRSG